MKILITILFSMSILCANEHRLLISGFSIHDKPTTSSGVAFNSLNYGLGYEYTDFSHYDRFYLASNFTVLEDSFYYTQYTLSASKNIRFKINEDISVSLGLAMFAMIKKDTISPTTLGSDPQYILIPGAAPLSSIYYKDLTLNFAYVPTIKDPQINITGFLIVYFGWEY